jgi:multiple sugar transport system ATP-binding protein
VTHDQLEAMTMSDRIAVMRDGRIQQFDIPARIYNEPANLFVASFIGSPPMNLLEGELTDRAGTLTFAAPNVSVTLPDGLAQRARTSGTANQVLLGIRPENIKINREAGDASAQVSLIEVVGAEQYVTLDTDAGAIIARLSTDEPVEEGERLFCTFSPQNLHLFSRDTGDRVS